jgi:hypothetical protein
MLEQIETAGFSETLVLIYRTTLHHMPAVTLTLSWEYNHYIIVIIALYSRLLDGGLARRNAVKTTEMQNKHAQISMLQVLFEPMTLLGWAKTVQALDGVANVIGHGSVIVLSKM